jgi:hypothetical protein
VSKHTDTDVEFDVTKVEVDETETPTLVEDALADMSPIELAKIAGVRPQMVYNYIGSGLIKGAFRNEAGKLRVPTEIGLEWVAKYSARKVEREAKRQAALEAELAGTTEVSEPSEVS